MSFLLCLVQPAVTPVMTPMFTPSSSYQGPHMTTPRSGATPSYQPTPRPAVGPGAPWPGVTPRTPAARTPRQVTQTPTSYSTPRQNERSAGSSSDMDWARAAEMWANRKKTAKSPRPSPKQSPARRAMGSPFGGGMSPQGDGTPLVDER